MKASVFILLFIPWLLEAKPTASEIIKAIDENTFANSIEMTSSMIVHGKRATRTIKSKTWSEGDKRSFTEFLSPPREKGVKMLRIEDDLWTYYPRADRIVKIAGHMLRQSVMGSDLSYEDMMEERKLSEIYNASISNEETYERRECFVLRMVAKQDDVSYQSKTIWVDKERMIPLKEELYAKSGKLLKELTVHQVKRINSRWYPMHMTYKDKLQDGKGTEIRIHEIKFDSKIPTTRFQKSALRR